MAEWRVESGEWRVRLTHKSSINLHKRLLPIQNLFIGFYKYLSLSVLIEDINIEIISFKSDDKLS